MMGKLHWRRESKDHGSNASIPNGHVSKGSMGGLVSIDETTEHKPPVTKRKTPSLSFLGLNKQIYTTTPVGVIDPASTILTSSPTPLDQEGFVEADQDSVFRFPAVPTKRHSASSRPRTADSADLLSGPARKRSGTLPTHPAPEEQRVDISLWRPQQDLNDKPLPLALDMEPRRNIYGSGASTIPMHRTRMSQSLEPTTRRQPLKAQYSLIPQISTSFGDRSRPSLNSASSSTGPSSASSRFPTSSTSRTSSTRSSSTPREPSTLTVKHDPAIRNSILDEVEGTLSATITELQELQTHSIWQQGKEITPIHSPGRETPRSSVRSVSSSTTTAQGDAYFHQSKASGSWDSTVTNSNGTSNDSTPTGNSVVTRNSLSPPPLNPSKTAQEDRMVSLQTSFDEQSSINKSLTLENDSLRERLEVLEKRLSAFENEKPNLVRAAKDAEDHLQLTLSKLREAKVSELAAQKEFQSARNAISISETRYNDERNRHDATKEELKGEQEKNAKLAGKLEEVNAQKVDLLEGGVEMRKHVVVTKKKLRKALEELNGLKKKEKQSNEEREQMDGQRRAEEEGLQRLVEERTRKEEELKRDMRVKEQALHDAVLRMTLLEKELTRAGQPGSDLPAHVADLSFRLEDAENKLIEKSLLVEALTHRNEEALALVERFEREVRETRHIRGNTSISSTSSPIDYRSSRQIMASDLSSGTENWQLMNKKFEESESARKAAIAERDRVLELLRAEVRRIAIEEHGIKHPSLPFLKKRVDLEEATVLVQERARAFLKDCEEEKDKATYRRSLISNSDGSIGTETPEDEAARLRTRIQRLESEIDYYLKDIVLYKLDVKGYKKDLKKAEKRIRDMELGPLNTTIARASPIPMDSGRLARASPVPMESGRLARASPVPMEHGGGGGGGGGGRRFNLSVTASTIGEAF